MRPPCWWACVCSDWHTGQPHVITDRRGRVIHAPVSDAEAEAEGVAPLT